MGVWLLEVLRICSLNGLFYGLWFVCFAVFECLGIGLGLACWFYFG